MASLKSPLAPQLLEKLSEKKATGLDHIPAWLVKTLCGADGPCHSCIITSSIIEGKYPALYKHTLISPEPKVNPAEVIETNLWQILVLPVLAVLERVQLRLNRSKLFLSDNHLYQHSKTLCRPVSMTQIIKTWPRSVYMPC